MQMQRLDLCIGQEMVQCHKKKQPMPVLLEELPNNTDKEKLLIRLIQSMTEYEKSERSNISDVFLQLTGNFILLIGMLEFCKYLDFGKKMPLLYHALFGF